MTVRYKFTAREGEYLLGVPAKDLTDDEIDSLTPEQRRLLDANLKSASPVYELVGKGGKSLSTKMPEGLPMPTRDLTKDGDSNVGVTVEDEEQRAKVERGMARADEKAADKAADRVKGGKG
jgi:hypothetical protein